MALRRENASIFYKTRTEREGDFVIPMKAGGVRLVQVCEMQARPETRIGSPLSGYDVPSEKLTARYPRAMA